MPIILLSMFFVSIVCKTQAQSPIGISVQPIVGDLYHTGGNLSLWNNDVGYISGANLKYLWQENGDNIFRNKGNVGIGTNYPKKSLHITSYNSYGNPTPTPVKSDSPENLSTIRLENINTNYSPSGFPVTHFSEWDFENNNNILNINYKGGIIQLGNIDEKNFSFSADGTFTAEKFVGDGSGLTNIDLNGPLILDNDMEPWTNIGWSARLQSPLGTVWASTNKSNLGDYYLGLGMTNSGWYFMKRNENGAYNYVTVIREDGRIQCSEVVIAIREWQDNVFNKNYNLKSIEETEQYISQHGHLPEIPSEKEIIKNGLKTSEMIKLQMQKIEELTLYIIEQNKRIKALEEKAGSKQ